MPALKGTRPPAAGKGRPVGAKNKITGDLRAMVLQALADEGGVEYLRRQARKRNPGAFMALVGKCMPKDINVGAQESLADLLRDAEESLAKRRSGSTANLVQDAGDHC